MFRILYYVFIGLLVLFGLRTAAASAQDDEALRRAEYANWHRHKPLLHQKPAGPQHHRHAA